MEVTGDWKLLEVAEVSLQGQRLARGPTVIHLAKLRLQGLLGRKSALGRTEHKPPGGPQW